MYTHSASQTCYFINGNKSVLPELRPVFLPKLCLAADLSQQKSALSHWIRQKHLIPQNRWAATHLYTLLVTSSDQHQADISFLFHRRISLERSGNQMKFVNKQGTDCLCNTKKCHTEQPSPVAVTAKHRRFILLRCTALLLYLIFHSLISCL